MTAPGPRGARLPGLLARLRGPGHLPRRQRPRATGGSGGDRALAGRADGQRRPLPAGFTSAPARSTAGTAEAIARPLRVADPGAAGRRRGLVVGARAGDPRGPRRPRRRDRQPRLRLHRRPPVRGDQSGPQHPVHDLDGGPGRCRAHRRNPRLSRPAWTVVGATVLSTATFKSPQLTLIRDLALLCATVDAATAMVQIAEDGRQLVIVFDVNVRNRFDAGSMPGTSTTSGGLSPAPAWGCCWWRSTRGR